MLKIVQDKHLLKTLVATLIRMRRSKEQHSTDNTNSQNISHRLIRACMYQTDWAGITIVYVGRTMLKEMFVYL
jgi:hypothetical protein